jgi:hypothetical protein
VVGGARPDVVTPTGGWRAIPPAIARIDDDGDGEGPRFYSVQGALVRPPAMADRLKMGVPESVFAKTDALSRAAAALASSRPHVSDEARDWVETVRPSAGRKGLRRAALRRQFGRPIGRVSGLDRYVQTIGDETTELLADDDWAIPLQINVVRGGVLESQASFAYEGDGGGSLVRRRSHVEQVLPGGQGVRIAVDVDLARVTLEERR